MQSSFFNPFPRLETPHLILRETLPGDAEAILEIFRSEAVTRYHNQPTFTELAQAEQVVGGRRRLFESGNGIRWCIIHRQDARVIGGAGLSNWDPHQRRAEVGYELHEDYWGRGLMTEALQALLAFGFTRMELNRVEALVMLENAASERLLGRFGFVEEGVLREYGFWKGRFHDLKLFSLLCSEWGSHPKRAGGR